MVNYEDFTKQYQVSKTLRFSLIPINETLENIKKEGFLEKDESRSDDYQEVKPILDKIYKEFADKALDHLSVNWKPLADAIEKYRISKTLQDREELRKIQEKIRKEIAGLFKGVHGNTVDEKQESLFKDIFSKKMFDGKVLERIDSIVLSAEEEKLLQKFTSFTTYFTGFYENRRNVFSDDDISTAIPHRIVQDNFPKFFENCKTYSRIKNQFPQLLDLLEKAKENLGILPEVSLDEMFSLQFYNHVVQQKNIDAYNQILGGIAGEAGEKKLQGLNETINLMMQQDGELKKALQNVPHRFIPLFKQILSDRTSLSFISDSFETDAELLDALKHLDEEVQTAAVAEKVKTLFIHWTDFNLAQIYISNSSLDKLSNAVYGQWDFIRNQLYMSQLNKKAAANGKVSQKEEGKIRSWIKNHDFSLTELRLDADPEIVEKCSAVLKEAAENFVKISRMALPSQLLKDNEREEIRNHLDGYMDFLHILEWFDVDLADEVDPMFLVPYEEIMAEMRPVPAFYNKVRNYVTKKPYSTEKYKLTFSIPTLADGWDNNKEKDNRTVIFMKDDKYYLGIMKKGNEIHFPPAGEDSAYFKMNYRFFPSVSKMIPKCSTQRKDVKAHFGKESSDMIIEDQQFNSPLVITKEIYDLNNVQNDEKKKFQKSYLDKTGDEKGYRDALKKWIDFSKEFLKKYESTSHFDYSSVRPTSEYDSLNDFYNDLNHLSYCVAFDKVSETAVNQMVADGKLFLFQIYNKDFAPGHTGRPNLHTMYWKAIFSDENLKYPRIKLNGQAELFYRPKSKMEVVRHRVGEKLVNKKMKDGRTPVPELIYEEVYKYVNGKLKGNLSSEAQALLPDIEIRDVKHEIIKDRRYARDQFFFHLPITLNFQSERKVQKFNDQVTDYLKDHPETPVIGIDRGERNLLYLVVIDGNGKILEQRSLNLINGYDYHEKLADRERERTKARQSWTTIGKIKDLKQGYLSQAIHEITCLMVKYHAIVVLENLNFGFMSKRTGIAEKAVYQQFEKMLIDKLNCLVLKEAELDEPGSVLNPYQLTDQFSSFAKMGNQSGFLFYVPAAYTSKIDPMTGFVDPFSWKAIKTDADRREFLEGFSSLCYDAGKDRFILHMEMKNNQKYQRKLTGFMPDWDIVFESNVERQNPSGESYRAGKRIIAEFANHRRTGQYKEVYPCTELKQILSENDISYNHQEDLLQQVLNKKDPKLNRLLVELIREVFQMRNSCAAANGHDEEDYISSPVAAVNDQCFDSREGLKEMPVDADANGAYHIAMKGKLLLERLRDTDNKKSKNKKMQISNNDWLQYIQQMRN